MCERQSPLSEHIRQSAPECQRDIRLTERIPVSLFQVATWADSINDVTRTVSAATGIPIPSEPGQVRSGNGNIVMNIGPRRMLIETGDVGLLSSVCSGIYTQQGAVTNLSDARTVIYVTGRDATWLLSKGLAVDTDKLTWPVGQVVQSSIHGIGVIVSRIEVQAFDLYVYRGFALSLWEWITDMACEKQNTLVADAAHQDHRSIDS